MADIVQMGVDQFWSQLQNLQNILGGVKKSLDADRSQLSALYAKARADKTAAGAQHRALLDPLVHNNSDLRITYLKPVQDKFTAAVNGAAAVLKKAGYTAPGLTGMGIAPALIIVPAVAVAAVLLGLEAAKVVSDMTAAQRTRTAAVAKLMADPGTSAAQKAALLAAIQAQTKAEKAANPPLFDPTAFVLPLALVLGVVFFANRKSAA